MKLSTLGPKNTNSQFACDHYLSKKQKTKKSEVLLYDTAEEAINGLLSGDADLAILCVVYPRLHEIVFENLTTISIIELFYFETDNMVVASKGPVFDQIRACCHPAPQSLLPETLSDITLVNSNSIAASLVSKGIYDICITTQAAAKQYSLDIVKDYGPVPMGWAVFQRIQNGH